MDAQEKARIESLVKNRFWGIGNVIGGVVQAKEAYRARLVALDNQRTTYHPDELAKQKAKAQETYNQARLEAYNGLTVRLDELKAAINERHAALDLEDPNWQNALAMIELLGGGTNGEYPESLTTNGEIIRKINASFAYNQPALKALHQIYKARQFSYDGDIDKQIYDIESAFADLQKICMGTFKQEGYSINKFAFEVGKIADLEGMTDFNKQPDPQGMIENLRYSAGLVK